MFALRVTYLLGRVYASDVQDGDLKLTVEWPPHPSRLFSALVAAWAETDSPGDLAFALDWLAEQPAPSIYAGKISERTLVTTYVPANEAKSLPEARSRKARNFPSASLSSSDVYFLWPEAPGDTVIAAFEPILNRTCSLGHSSSLVSVDVVDDVPQNNLDHWQTGNGPGQRLRLRVPSQGRLQYLQDIHARFQKDPIKVYRPGPGKTEMYRLAAPHSPSIPKSIFTEMIVLRRSIQTPSKLGLRSTLQLTSALRGAMLANAPQPVPEFLSGHTSEGKQTAAPHVALVPLSFTGAPHATGEVMGLGVLVPCCLTPDERSIAWSTFASISNLRMGWGGLWKLELSDAEESRATLQEETWVRPSLSWSTVTPFVFDRFPKDPDGDEAEAVIRTALARVGLPEPAQVEMHANPWHVGVPQASAFPPAPARAGRPRRYHCHVALRFNQPVSGPIVAGAGRHYGYGLFRPFKGLNNR